MSRLRTSLIRPFQLRRRVGLWDERAGSRTRRRRLAVANFVQGTDQIYGVYSIHVQLSKYNMTRGDAAAGGDERETVDHVVVVPNNLQKELREALVLWLGEGNVRSVNASRVLGRLKDEQMMWKGTFNKLWLFNLTDFDKVIMLDADVLIRSNIMHWFEYPAPCGVQAKDDLAYNSGAMVIAPDAGEFEKMLDLLPRLQRYIGTGRHKGDPLNGGYSDQDFLTAYYLHNVSDGRRRCILPTEAAVLSSSLSNQMFQYFAEYRPWLFQTVHFTTHKPWRPGTRTTDLFLCQLLREWNESVSGVERYYNVVTPLTNDYLENCTTGNG